MLLPLGSALTACTGMGSGVVDETSYGVAELALCPAPSTPVSFGVPEVVFQAAGSDLTQPGFGVAGDFNGDGETDAVFLDGRDNVLSTVLGTGDGTVFVGHDQLAPYTAPFYYPQGSATLDFEGDGDLDLAYVTQGGASLVIALNDGSANFTLGPRLVIPATYGMKRLVTGDFDGDGRPDAAIVANLSRKLQVVLNTAGGLVVGAAMSTGNYAPFDIATDDLDQDGHPDLVVGVTGPTPFYVYHGNGNGTFTQVAAPVPVGQAPNGASTTGLLLTDLDADGLADAAYVEATTHAVHVFRNVSSAGNLAFANESASGSGPYVLSEALSDIWLTAGDFDVDGKIDLGVVGKVFTVGARFHVLTNATSSPGAIALTLPASPFVINSNGKTNTTPRGAVVAAFNTQSCGARAELLFASNNNTAADWSIQYVRNTTE